MTTFEKYTRVFILSILYAASMALPYIHFKFYDVIRSATNTTNTELGYLMTVLTVLSMILYIPAGIIGDRMSAKRILIASCILSATCNILFALFPSFSFALCIWAVLAVANGGSWPCLIKAVRDSGSEEEQGRMFGTFYGAQGFVMVLIGFIDAGIYGSFTDSTKGFEYMLFFQAVMLILSAVLILIFLKDVTPYNQNVQTESTSAFVSVLTIIKSPKVWIMVTLIFCGYGCYISMGYLTPYTTNVLGASITMGAVLGTIRVYGIRIFAGPLSGYIADKLGAPSKLMIISFVALLFMMIYLLNISENTSHNVIIAITMFTSLACMMMYCVMFAGMEELKIPARQTATAVSVISILGFLPDAIFPPLYGFWLDKYGNIDGYITIFCFIIGLIVIGLLSTVAINVIGKKQAVTGN